MLGYAWKKKYLKPHFNKISFRNSVQRIMIPVFIYTAAILLSFISTEYAIYLMFLPILLHVYPERANKITPEENIGNVPDWTSHQRFRRSVYLVSIYADLSPLISWISARKKWLNWKRSLHLANYDGNSTSITFTAVYRSNLFLFFVPHFTSTCIPMNQIAIYAAPSAKGKKASSKLRSTLSTLRISYASMILPIWSKFQSRSKNNILMPFPGT